MYAPPCIDGRRPEDDGHEHWLKSLQTKKGAAAAFLERLRTRKRDLVAAKEAVRTFQESWRRIEPAAWEVRRDKQTVHPYGSGGQEGRADWMGSTPTYLSVAAAPRTPVRAPALSAQFRRVDPWDAIDLEAQRRAAVRRTMPHEDAGGDSGGCVSALRTFFRLLLPTLEQRALFWIIVGWVGLWLWLG